MLKSPEIVCRSASPDPLAELRGRRRREGGEERKGRTEKEGKEGRRKGKGYSRTKDPGYDPVNIEASKNYDMKNLGNKSSAVAEMGDRLATIHMGRKVGDVVPLGPFLWGGELRPHLTQCCLG